MRTRLTYGEVVFLVVWNAFWLGFLGGVLVNEATS